jgi:hypothetical protein
MIAFLPNTTAFFGYTATFLGKIRNRTNLPNLRLVYDGANYDDEVISVSQVVRSLNLSAGTVTVVVDNSAGTFNGRITDDTWDQQRAYVQMYFDGLAEYMNLFAGIVTRVTYQGATATIYIRDHMAQMLNREVGDWENEEDYYSAAYNPADLVWAILTDSNYGNLDNTAGVGNTDIDYTQWGSWKTDMTNTSYSIQGRFTGQTIRDILMRVCFLTDSYIWVNGDGLFEFAMHDGASLPTGSENYTDANIVPEDESNIPFLDTDIDNPRNQISSWYGYDPDTEKSTGASGVDAGSQAQYGKFRAIDKSTWLWHADSASSSAFRTAYLQRHADPYRQIEFESFMASWLEDIGHTVSVTNGLLSITSQTMTIIEMILYPMDGRTHMKLYWDWD